MPEPTSSTVLIATSMATGLTLFGVATGLHPAILFAGLAGGLWSLSYQPPKPFWKRTATTIMAAIVSGYLAPAVSVGLMSIDVFPRSLTLEVTQLPVAVLIGLVSHRVLGPAILRIVARKTEDMSK
jgi:hypothetical protein